MLGGQEFASVGSDGIQRRVPERDMPLSAALAVEGLMGHAAYFRLLDIEQPKAGETVVVSATGAVGSCIGQIARLKGCRTISIAGGLDQQLAEACAGGGDIYFGNTAGPISGAVLRQIDIGPRLVVWGTVSAASWDPVPIGPRVERHRLVKRRQLQGPRVRPRRAVRRGLGRAYDMGARGRDPLPRRHVLEGIVQAPGAIAGLYRCNNLGKRLIPLAAEQSTFISTERQGSFLRS
jgi:NADPH-dependent curcumin reductase CurA